MFKKKEKETLEQYQDPTGEFTNRELKLAQWYASHKLLLRKIFIAVTGTWSVITIGIGLFVFGEYLLFGYNNDEMMINKMTQSYIPYEKTHVLNAPQPLLFRNPQVFSDAKDKYDLTVEVTNPNNRWIAYPKYKFIYYGGETEVHDDVILPGESRFTTIFGHKAPQGANGARAQLVDVTWKRIDPHKIFDPLDFIEHRLQFSTDNVEFIPDRTADDIDVHLISFDIKNDSLFSYWEGQFNVIFKSRGTIVGIAPLQIDQFRGGETRNVELASLMYRLQVDDVDVEPLINVFDEGMYMPLR